MVRYPGRSAHSGGKVPPLCPGYRTTTARSGGTVSGMRVVPPTHQKGSRSDEKTMSRSVTLSDVATLVDGRKSSGIEHEQMRASRPPKFPCAVKLERDLRRNGRMCHTHRCCCTAARIAANDLGGCDPGATVAVPSTEKTPISTSELGELTVRRNAALGRHAASGYERRRKEQAHERGRKQMWKVFRGSAGSPCEFSSLLTRSWRRLPPACNVGSELLNLCIVGGGQSGGVSRYFESLKLMSVELRVIELSRPSAPSLDVH